MDRKSPASTPDEPRQATDRRRPYAPPRLTEYGPVSKLTQNTPTGSFADGMGGMRMGACL